MTEQPTSPSPRTAPPKDADVYAGIRWSVNSLENLALEAYWNDRANWEAIRACLDAAFQCLYPLATGAGGDDCPWPPCDGRCTPLCPPPS